MKTKQDFNLTKIICRVMLAQLATVTFPVLAEESIDTMEFPVVLTASRMKQPLSEAPAAITVIDRAMIDAAGVRQIADLLRLVPGAVVGYNDGNLPVATLRGLSGVFASGLQVLIDGVSVYSPIFGGMYWGELPISINDIERIEVVRGPNAASYGSNSFQGVVNIITKDPTLVGGFSAQANVGGNGISDAELRGGGGQQDWRYRATIAQHNDEGFKTRPDSERWTFANARSNYRIDAADNLDFSLRWADKSKDYGIYTPTLDTSSPRDQTGKRMELQARWSRAESSDREWWVQVYHQSASTRERLPLDVRALIPPLALYPVAISFEYELDYMSERDGIEFQSLYGWSDTLRSVMGGEMRRDATRSGRLFGTNKQLTAFLGRVFGNLEWRMAPDWIVNAGTMFERNTLADNSWSPRLALIHDISPGHTIRTSISAAKRTPSLVEKYADYHFVAQIPLPPFQITTPILDVSGNVHSESVTSREIGYVFNIRGAMLSGDVRWFSDRYTSLIGLTGNTPADAINADDARITGLDLTLDWRPRDSTWIRLAAAHSSTHATDRLATYSTSVPRNTLSLLLSQSFSNEWTASANYQRVGAMFWLDSGQKQQSIPAIDHLNLKLAKKFRYGNHDVELAGVVQNALGHYRDYYLATPLSPRDNVANRLAFLQMTLDF